MTWPDACSFAVDRSKTDLAVLTRIISALGGVLVRRIITRSVPLSLSHCRRPRHCRSPPSSPRAPAAATCSSAGSGSILPPAPLYGVCTGALPLWSVSDAVAVLCHVPFLSFPFLSFLFFSFLFLSFPFLPHRFVLSSACDHMHRIRHPSRRFPLIKTVTTCQGPPACKT